MLKRLFASRKHPYVPGLNRPEKIEIDISGSRLTLLTPPHSYRGGFGTKEPPEQVNLYDPSIFESDESMLPEWQRQRLAGVGLYRRNWCLYGPPWRGNPYGTIDFGCGILRHDALPESMSCFNPAHFEQMALRHLWFSGPAQPDRGTIRSPVNWHTRRESGATWLYFEEHKDYGDTLLPSEDFMRTFRESYLWIPLDDRYHLKMSFRYLGYAPVEQCLANMNAMRDSVLRSIQLDLSAAARKSLEDAQRKWPQARASDNRAPEPWIYPEWRDGDSDKGEDYIVILKPGSPPPALVPDNPTTTSPIHP